MASQPFVYAPGVGDPHDAGLVAKAGFPVVYLSGFSIANKQGFPDVGLLTLTEMAQTARRTVRFLETGNGGVPNIPVVADADDGYGNFGNVMRTVEEYAVARVAALHIEDQVFPKRCGHIAGKVLVPMDEAVGKYKAAVMARDKMDPNLYLIARTDAAGAVGGSLDEAIKRGRAYADAGVDSVWAELGNTNSEPLERFAQEMRKTHPEIGLAVNYSSNLGWNGSGITFKQLGEMGYTFIFTTLAALEAGRLAVYDHLFDLNLRGAAAQHALESAKKGHPVGSSQTSMDMLPRHQRLEALLVPGATERRDGSEGFGSGNDKHARQVHQT